MGMSRLLAEELLLLCWDDERGTLHRRCSTTVGPGVGGALVVDAVLAGALEISGGRVRVTGDDPGDPLLVEVVAAANRHRPASVARLVQEVGTMGRYRAVRDRLVDQGVLRVDRRRLLGGVPYTRYPSVDPAVTGAVREPVHALLTGRLDPSGAGPRDVVLAGLAVPTGAVDVLVARGQRAKARRRMETFGDPHARAAAGQAVPEQQIAAIAAITGAVTGRPVAVEESVGQRDADEPAYPVPVEEVGAGRDRDGGLEVDPAGGEVVMGMPDVDIAGGRRRAQPPGDDGGGRRGGLGVALGLGAGLLIGINVIRRRLASRARTPTQDSAGPDDL